ncbi:protein of unknown function DUF990 [Paenibacillus curdlanolyticus YK9]|uniref:ABC transporter permease protein n=1 Tax=Paenibacillus curdlanolyticus YK9 TaxID=717606 RepID=E0I7G1_9BACL|nr:ABC-2 family transporter protein [Paenibacillus curdlanolyticus]EFM11977.1 protein of unknown function DUF990 [Paenibacillus curdlanolyticus YK9]
MGKYLKAVKLSAQITFSYNRNFFISSAIQIFSLLITIFLWRAVFHMGGSIEHYSFSDMILYIFVVNTLFDFISTNNISERVSNDIRTGQLSIYLMRPYPHVLALFADLFGTKLTKVPMLFILNGLVGGIIYYCFSVGSQGIDANLSLHSAGMFLLFVFFSFLWNYLFDYLLGLIAFWVDNPWILFYVKGHVTAVFCGLIIPLNLFPAWAQHVLDYLPFRYYVYYPYQVLTGEVGLQDYAANLAYFIGWILVITLIMYAIWKKSVARFTAAGG